MIGIIFNGATLSTQQQENLAATSQQQPLWRSYVSERHQHAQYQLKDILPSSATDIPQLT